MSPEIYTIISVAIGLAALILNGQLSMRRALAELRQDLNDLRSEMHRRFEAQGAQIAALAERVARLEGVILGPRDFARDTGTDNAA